MRRFKKLAVKFRRFRRARLEHPFAVPIITLLSLGVLTGVFFLILQARQPDRTAADNKIVIISHDHQQQIVPSKEATVGSLLQKLNLHLGQGDVVEPALTAHIDQDQFRINIYRAVPVEIIDNNHRSFTFSASKTPRAIAQQAGTNLFPEDVITTQPVNNFLNSGAIGEQVLVDRATPVDVDLYGAPVVLRTHAKTVGGLIREKHIHLIKNDQVVPAPNTPLTAGQHIAFLRTGTRTETVTEEIAMPVQTVTDNTLAYGTSAVRQQGAPGQQAVTYQVAITNNVETGRTAIQKVVIKAPVTQITVVGTSLSGIKGDMALAGIAPGDYNYADYIISHESGWNPSAGNSSGAYGLCQALPGSKMGSAGADWASNPITQLRWCNGYAQRSYGGWANAYAHWVNNRNW